MAEALTGKRQQILEYIGECLRERGYPPSVREIGEAVGLASSATVHTHLAVLQREGYLYVAFDTFVPSFRFDSAYTLAIVAVFGTTISPYLFFWQSSQEAEDEHQNGTGPLLLTPLRAPKELRRIRVDTYLGMFFSNIVGWFIIVAVAATLHAHGITNIETTAQAAQALRPIAGPFAFALFAL